MSDLKPHHRALLWTLKEMGGEAWRDELIRVSGVSVVDAIPILRSLKGDGYLDAEHESGRLWLISDISAVPRPPVNVVGMARFKSKSLAKSSGDGLSSGARDLLRHMIEMLYQNPDLPSPLVSEWPKLKPFEIEIVERRARQLVAEHPLPD